MQNALDLGAICAVPKSHMYFSKTTKTFTDAQADQGSNQLMELFMTIKVSADHGLAQME